jgi:hypothetical protein
MPQRQVTVDVKLSRTLYDALVKFSQRKAFTVDQCITAAVGELLAGHDPEYPRKRHRAPTFMEMLLRRSAPSRSSCARASHPRPRPRARWAKLARASGVAPAKLRVSPCSSTFDER